MLDRELQRGATNVLDAGCGTGLFTQRAAMLGFAKIDAVDFSATAAEVARRNAPTSTVRVAALDDLRSTERYDVVMCIDVLFHIVDNATWARSVRNLADLTAPYGALVIQDSLNAADEAQPAPHVRFRSLHAYQRELAEWVVDVHDKYLLPNEAISKDLVLFRRCEALVD
jgi:2-polyprenyl-3-methyl-5-hydroxy-6-metoxy-1,4-benzoquinol methylase